MKAVSSAVQTKEGFVFQVNFAVYFAPGGLDSTSSVANVAINLIGEIAVLIGIVIVVSVECGLGVRRYSIV